MDPLTISAIITTIGNVLGKLGSHNNDTQGQRERLPFANVEGEWVEFNRMLKEMIARAQQEQNTPIDMFLTHTGVPELEEGRGRKVPDHLKPQSQRWRGLTPPPGAVALPAPGSNSQSLSGPTSPISPTTPTNPNTPSTGGPGEGMPGGGETPVPFADPYSVQEGLARILGDVMGRSSSPSRISPTIADETVDDTMLRRRKPVSPPQTYGAAQLLLHALGPQGANSGMPNLSML